MSRDDARLIADLSEQIRALPCVDARARDAHAAVLDALRRLPRPFDADADLTHVTASAVVVGRRGVLLHRHKRLGFWMQPGGHVDAGELPPDAAVREVAEETGLAATHPGAGPFLAHVDVHAAARGHVHLDLRYLLRADGDPAPPPGESQAVRWHTWAEAEAIADPGLIGALRALRPDRQPVR